jgi:two-component system, OmpR family, sensor histidine kinase QseC
MKSLRARLLVVLLLTLLSFWGAWLAWQISQTTRQQTGTWDASLQLMANQVLLSLPANFADLEMDTVARMRAPQSSAVDKFFQVWRLPERHIALLSGSAPAEPLKRDFRDGFASQDMNDGDRWRVYALSDTSGRIQVHVGKRESLLRAELLASVRHSLLAAGAVFIGLACAVWLVIRWSLRPAAAIRQLLEQRQSLDLRPLPAGNLPDEIRPLVDSFNGLLAQLDVAMQSERRFIADAAHELRTPLAALMAHAQLALRAESPEASKEALLKLIAGVERGARLSEQLLDSARLDARRSVDSARRIDLHEVAGVVAHEFAAMAAQRGQSLSVETQPASIQGHVDDLGILIRNLIDNASRYAGSGARIAVTCRTVETHNGARAQLTVADDGPGVPHEEWDRIFDRFYRAPGSAGRGSGIGLSLVARIAEVHQARIGVDVGLDRRGLAITVQFPAAPDVTEAVQPRPALAPLEPLSLQR